MKTQEILNYYVQQHEIPAKIAASLVPGNDTRQIINSGIESEELRMGVLGGVDYYVEFLRRLDVNEEDIESQRLKMLSNLAEGVDNVKVPKTTEHWMQSLQSINIARHYVNPPNEWDFDIVMHPGNPIHLDGNFT